MTTDADADVDEGVAERFRTLADETRLRIIDVLATAAGDGPLSYSTLQSRVGVRDNGRLNYHLSQLVGEFVARTESGYALLPAGRFAPLVATSRAGETTGPVRMDAEADCHRCGERLVARYERDHTFVVRCPSCERVYLTLVVPFARPGVASSSTFLDAMNDTAHDRFALLARGLCPWCRSPTATGVVTDGVASDGRRPERRHLDVRFRHRCTSCATVVRTTPGELLVPHPELGAVHRRRGRPLSDRYVWAVPFAVTDRPVTVRSRDPWRVGFRTTVGDTAVECVRDGDGDVREFSTRSHLRGV